MRDGRCGVIVCESEYDSAALSLDAMCGVKRQSVASFNDAVHTQLRKNAVWRNASHSSGLMFFMGRIKDDIQNG